jgi:hypothetical protein
MQGGTVQTAIVLASPRDLTAGWSYTALSRARGPTRLLVCGEDLAAQRSDFAPTERTETVAARGELLARVQQRMLQRDDEDLAVEQLPGPRPGAAAGRPDDPQLARAQTLAHLPPQEHAAARAEPNTPAPPAGPARLQEAGERIEQLRAQLAALPTRELQRIEDLDARASTLATQREQLTARLATLPALPAPTRQRGRGREHDPHAVARAHLQTALTATERELTRTLTDRARHEHNLGANPAEARTERDALKHALARLTREQRTIEVQSRADHHQDRRQATERHPALDVEL